MLFRYKETYYQRFSVLKNRKKAPRYSCFAFFLLLSRWLSFNQIHHHNWSVPIEDSCPSASDSPLLRCRLGGTMAPLSDAETAESPAKPPQLVRSDDDAQRFEVELEFVQCLASPAYLNCTLMCAHSIRILLRSTSPGQSVEFPFSIHPRLITNS